MGVAHQTTEREDYIMAMTKNIRTTMNTISKLFVITNETHDCMHDVHTAKTVKESIEAAKSLNNLSKRVDRLCAKLGFDREVVDELFLMSEGCEDTFVLHILSTNEYAFSAYMACASEDVADEDEITEESAE